MLGCGPCKQVYLRKLSLWLSRDQPADRINLALILSAGNKIQSRRCEESSVVPQGVEVRKWRLG